MLSARRVLLVAPHADDELLGAGGTLLRLRAAGASVRLVLVACSDVRMRHNGLARTEDRRREFCEVAAELATEPPEVYGLRDTALDAGDLVPRLDATLDTFAPDTVLVPEPGYHQDHQAVYRACMAALRPTARAPFARVLAYEVPTSTWSGLGPAFEPRVFVDVTKTLDAKLGLFRRCYRSQYTTCERRQLAEEGIRRHARYRGTEAGVEAAEAFALVREVVR